MVHHTHDRALNSLAKMIAKAATVQRKIATKYLYESRLDEYVHLTIKKMEEMEGIDASVRRNENWHLYLLKERGTYTIREKRGKVDRQHGNEQYNSDVHARLTIANKVDSTKDVRGGIRYLKAKLVS